MDMYRFMIWLIAVLISKNLEHHIIVFWYFENDIFFRRHCAIFFSFLLRRNHDSLFIVGKLQALRWCEDEKIGRTSYYTKSRSYKLKFNIISRTTVVVNFFNTRNINNFFCKCLSRMTYVKVRAIHGQ
jgi:hypothetical protein